jgi:glutathione S-transferase
MADIELYSAALCPYVHRSHLTLLEKDVPFKLVEIDLQNRPANFTDISPYNKVPVLKHGDVRVWESAVINEYLEEIFPSPPLLPEDPVQHAQARIWINFADTQLFANTRKILHSFDPQQSVEDAPVLIDYLRFIEHEALVAIH